MVHVNKLTAVSVAKAKLPGYYLDGAGLLLQISSTGTKSWIYRYTFHGRRHEMGLGSCRLVDLARARELARDCQQQLRDGIDPLAHRRLLQADHLAERARQMTFDQCAAAYIKAHRGEWRNPKHVMQWENTLRTYASPLFGAVPVADIETDLIVKVLTPLWSDKTETATRLRGRIECILDWATVRKLRRGENPARWRGHLDKLLASPNKIAPVRNHAALDWREVGTFMKQLRQVQGIAPQALQFAILTAARSGEVRGACWDEIDLEQKRWTIPAGRMKAGKEHRVPLSAEAAALLEALPHRKSWLFPGLKRQSLSDTSLTSVLRRRMKRPSITVHGFRSTFRDWCAEAVGNAFPREVCEHALAHSLPDRVEAAYRRGDLLDKRAQLMQAWADYCSKCD